MVCSGQKIFSGPKLKKFALVVRLLFMIHQFLKVNGFG